MAQSMSKDEVIQTCVDYFPSFRRSREKAIKIQAWVDGKQYDASAEWDADDPMFGRAFAPKAQAISEEFENLRGISPNNFGGLVVASVAQTAYISGIRRPGENDVLPIWKNTFQRNRWDQRQIPIHRTAIGQGVAYGVVMPGKDPLTGTVMSKMIGKAPTRMAAFYDLDDDEYPLFAIEAVRKYKSVLGNQRAVEDGWSVIVWDKQVRHFLTCKNDGFEKDDWSYVRAESHGLPVCPVARCINRTDLEGRTTGEIEPVLPLLRRIDQDLFDRLIMQRFGAWQVRYIAGMAKPSKDSDAQAQKLRLSVEDILISTSEKTKFGVLPGGSIDNQTSATDADLRLLSAIAQIPPHHLLGLSSNLQAEALAAAEAGLQRKSYDFRQNAGEFHEQMARLAAMAEGDLVTAAAWDLQVRWKDTESRSFTQAVQALGVLATQLQVPLEMLWEEIPNWTDTDVARAKDLVETGQFEALLQSLVDQGAVTDPDTTTGETGGTGVSG